jgi:hypothetical protein
LTINGIWLSGVGRLPKMGQSPFARTYGDEQTARGLARLSGVDREPAPVEAVTQWEPGRDNLMVLTDLVSPILNADPFHWCETIQGMDRDMAPIVSELQRNKQAELLLYPCNGQVYRLTSNSLLRFWRRPKNLTDHLVET